MTNETPSTPPDPLPEAYYIPRAAIEAWLKIPETEYVNAAITRHDWDRFHESYDKMLHAQWQFQEGMVAYSNGDLAKANELYQRSRKLLIESQNAFRMMFTSLMLEATKPK